MLAFGSLGEVGKLDTLPTGTLSGLVEGKLAVVLSGRVLMVSMWLVPLDWEGTSLGSADKLQKLASTAEEQRNATAQRDTCGMI